MSIEGPTNQANPYQPTSVHLNLTLHVPIPSHLSSASSPVRAAATAAASPPQPPPPPSSTSAAAVLSTSDGLVSMAALMLGVATLTSARPPGKPDGPRRRPYGARPEEEEDRR